MRLTHHRNTRRKFGVLLRSEWMLQFSVIKSAWDLEFDEIRSRAIRVKTKTHKVGAMRTLSDAEQEQKSRVKSLTQVLRSDFLFLFASLPFPGADLFELDALCCRRCSARTASCVHQHGRNPGELHQAQW